MQPNSTLDVYGEFLETIPDAALVVNRRGMIVHVNSLGAQLFDTEAATLVGRQVHEMVPENQRRAHQQSVETYWVAPEVRGMGKSDFSAQRPDGSQFPADIMLAPVTLDSRPMVLCIVRDLSRQKAQETALKAALERERRLALSDPLVGIANKRHLELALAHEIEQLRRHHRPFTLIYLDLDKFKPLNDQYGHAEGDRVLKCLGSFLQEAVRKTDLVARVGGDEFVVLMVETSAVAARQRVPDFCSKVQQFFEQSPWAITVSIGAAVFTVPPETVETAISRVDDLMLRVKRAGRNGCLAEYGDANAEPCESNPTATGRGHHASDLSVEPRI